MKAHPILFSGPMVRAILDGRKTQTRRVVKLPLRGDTKSIQLTRMQSSYRDGTRPVFGDDCEPNMFSVPNRFGSPGDRLWVRETWAPEEDATGNPDDHGKFLYRATDPGWDDAKTGLRWRPSIFMPLRASRITLEVICVRVERVQDIREEDACAEGCPHFETPNGTCSEWFRKLWDSINLDRGFGWDSNPWVWVIEFRRVDQ